MNLKFLFVLVAMLVSIVLQSEPVDAKKKIIIKTNRCCKKKCCHDDHWGGWDW